MMFLLDTDTCVFWLRGRSNVQTRLAAVGPEALAVSTITLAELRYGADCSTQPNANHQAIDDFASGLTVLGVDAGIARRFGQIKATLRRQGNLIEDFDLLLAATAMAYDLTLITSNTAHYNRVADLIIEDWAQS